MEEKRSSIRGLPHANANNAKINHKINKNHEEINIVDIFLAPSQREPNKFLKLVSSSVQYTRMRMRGFG